MTPTLPEIARQLAVRPALLALAIAGALTAAALLAHSIAHWFDDKDS